MQPICLSHGEKQQIYSLLCPTSKSLLNVFESVIKRNSSNLDAYELLLSVSQELGGAYVYIPIEKRLKTRLRDVAIYEDFEAGASVNELAQKHQVSVQKVYRALKEISQSTGN
ncbi:Mor transcription activator family protein [Vibrio sp.]|uniref:Mor transcription activator family protein n=1 Tax=Vibrio sp. TaxID=678 RepID=UPI00378F98C0